MPERFDVGAAVRALLEPGGGPAPDLPFPDFPRGMAPGVLGEFVDLVTPISEAHPAALCLEFLATFGAMIGRTPGLYAVSTHRAKLFVAIVGDSSTARKSSGSSLVGQLLRRVDPVFYEKNKFSGQMNSGEGLLELVQDPKPGPNGTTLGTTDQRLLFIAAELSGIFKAIQRPNNILSEVLRQAWDEEPMAIGRRDAGRSTNHHVSVVGHATGKELMHLLTDTEITNGLANRFLFCVVRHTHYVPLPEKPDPRKLDRMANGIRSALDAARRTADVGWAPEARDLWVAEYEHLRQSKPGLLGPALNRSDSQVLRLALLYALLGGSSVIETAHLQAALAAWEYCEKGWVYAWAKWKTSNSVQQGVARTMTDLAHYGSQKIIDGVETGTVVTRAQISQEIFKRNKKASDIQDLMDLLVENGFFKVDGKGWRKIA